MKNIKVESNLVKTDWQFIAESYLALAYLGIEKLKNYIQSSDSEKNELHKREGGWYRAYAAQLLLIPILWNIKHAIELVLKAHTVNFQGVYFKTHNLSELKRELKKVFKINKSGQDEKFDEFAVLVDKYYKMEMFNNKKLPIVFDAENDFLRYPEGNRASVQLNLSEFGKITNEEINGLLEDIKLIDLRLAIPAEYQSIKNAGWNQFANPDNKIQA